MRLQTKSARAVRAIRVKRGGPRSEARRPSSQSSAPPFRASTDRTSPNARYAIPSPTQFANMIRATVQRWLHHRAGLSSENQAGTASPLTAASILATSILPIVIIASNARLATSPPWDIASVSTRGVICHDRPHLSLHQPHSLGAPPLPMIAFQYLSVSAWSSVAIWKENASLCLNAGPPFRPMHGIPHTVN